MRSPEPRRDAEAPPPARGRRLRSILLALALGTAVALGLGEAGARRALSVQRHLVHPPDLVLVRHPDPEVLPGVAPEARFATNADGLRGDPLPDDDRPRVLCLGGSTTACEYLDQASAWPQRLQAGLGASNVGPVWVGNAGRSGMTAADHVVQLPPLLEERPELDVLVLLVGVNDLAHAVQAGTWPADGGGDGPRVAVGAAMGGAERARRLERAFFDRPRTFALWPPARTALAHLVRRARARTWEAAALEDANAESYRERRALRAAALERAEARAELPDLRDALRTYREHLRFLVRTARRSGVTPLLCTQPTLWRADLEPGARALCWYGWIGAAPWDGPEGYLSLEALARGMAAFNDTLRQVGAEEGAQVVDLEYAVPRTLEHFYDDCHLTDAGAEVLRQALEPFVRTALDAR